MVKTNKQVWRDKWKQRKEPVNAFARTLVRRLGTARGRALLDVGCGSGVDSLYFAQRGFTVTAIDFSPSGIEALKEKAGKKGLKKVHASIHDVSQPLKYSDQSFDVIYAHLSLHYFDDRTTEKIFSDMHRLLRKGGYFFVKCKSVEDALYGKGTKVGPDMYRSDHVRHFFSAEYLRTMLEDFEILSLRKSSSSYHGKRSAFVAAIARRTS